MPEYNAAQKEAISAENHSILASAGAGAGKTSVMTERIGQQILYKGKKVEQMLVVTFTKEAASSMREKIRKYLRKTSDDLSVNPEVRNAASKAMAKMPECHISTIHSFCKYVLQTGYMIVNIDPQFDIADEVICRGYFDQAVKQAVDNISGSAYPPSEKRLFGAFKRAVSANELVEICRTLHDELMGIPDPYDRLHELVETVDLPEDKNPWVKAILDYNKVRLKTALSRINEFEDTMNAAEFPKKNRPAPETDIYLLKTLADEMSDETLTADELSACVHRAIDGVPSLTKYSTRGLTESEKEAYAPFQSLHKKILSDKTSVLQRVCVELDAVTNPQHAKDNQKIKSQLQGLEILIREVGKCFAEIKKENNQLDFSDLEQYAYQILTSTTQPEIRNAICKQYTDVYVDECQDVSGIQYAIIMALQTPTTNTFFVGDIKQSIYRFRHADPLLFLHLRDTYSGEWLADERKIYFQHNYRSSAGIIDSVNAVFANCMKRNLTEIDYEEGDHLLVGRNDIPSTQTEVTIIRDKLSKNEEIKPGETSDKLEAECVEVAERVKQLIEEGYQYKDIVILLRAKGKAPDIVTWLTKQHIPAYFEGKQSYFDLTEVAMLIQILKCIDNPRQDIPLITTLKNAPFYFTNEDLAKIRADYAKTATAFHECFNECADANSNTLEIRCHNARETINDWQIKAQITKTSDIIWMLLKQYGIYATQNAMPGGELRCKNLHALHQRAVSQEKAGHYRLSEFLGYIHDLTQVSSTGSEVPAPLGENDNFVRLMTIHASKGLEFPVVIIMEMQKKIHHDSSRTKLLTDVETSNGRTALGLYMPYVNRLRHISRGTYGKYAFEHKTYLNELAEETRMLYVAMTRAQERLIMVGFGSEDNESLWNASDKDARILAAKTMLDMVMPVALGGEHLPEIGAERNTPLWRVRYTAPMAANISDTANKTHKLPSGKTPSVNYRELWDGIRQNEIVPAKAAVTAIVNNTFASLDEDDDLTDTHDEDEKPQSFRLPDEAEPPLFLRPVEQMKTAANTGVLFHKFMELLDFTAFRGLHPDEYLDEAAEQLEIFHKKDVFNDDESVDIRKGIDGVIRFLKGKTGQMFIDGKVHLLREQDMTVEITSHNQNVMVQGVIDVMYLNTDGHWVIMDYKTDRNSDADAMIQKHKAQLNWYRMAVETITRIPVDTLCIISLRTGECHDVPFETPERFEPAR